MKFPSCPPSAAELNQAPSRMPATRQRVSKGTHPLFLPRAPLGMRKYLTVRLGRNAGRWRQNENWCIVHTSFFFSIAFYIKPNSEIRKKICTPLCGNFVLCKTGMQTIKSREFSLLFYGFPSIKCLRTRLPHHTVKYCLP